MADAPNEHAGETRAIRGAVQKKVAPPAIPAGQPTPITERWNLGELASRIHATAVRKGWWGEIERPIKDSNKMQPDSEAYRKAWHGEVRNPAEIIALFHSECTEVLEEWRAGHALTDTYYMLVPKERSSNKQHHEVRVTEGVYEYRLNPHLYQSCDGDTDWHQLTVEDAAILGYELEPHGIPTEMADVIIRVLDAAAAWGIDIEEAILRKMDFNTTRPNKHGGKRI